MTDKPTVKQVCVSCWLTRRRVKAAPVVMAGMPLRRSRANRAGHKTVGAFIY